MTNNEIIRRTLGTVFRGDLNYMRILACMEYTYAERIISGEYDATEQDVIMVEMAVCQMQDFTRIHLNGLRRHIGAF